MKVKRYINRDPYEQLAAAIVYQAVIDARRGDLLALDWLAGDECRAYCEFIGMDWQIIRAYTPGGDRAGEVWEPAKPLLSGAQG